ncbi:aminodeoxychorismate synthase component I [Dongia rigui]|uniref:aminodeoxychorismate synthase n=1 Tax=Dongia rigui TaxID=940149 RepID=A0ABU5E205_9PROT|nr:aminodeoxychorismate synthase component I [Dongia rigui]MDY0873534.1 aminodeoxychorismate synthase component I [Dongia rigui]
MIDGLQIHALTGPALDPLRWAAALRPAGGLVFFDSALAHETLGRYSFIMADPFHRLTADGARVTLDRAPVSGDPFTVLADLMGRYPQSRVPDLPPFQGGVAGSFGYGLRHHVERVPRHHRDDQDIPDLLLGAYDLVVAIDHVAGTGWLISSGLPASGDGRRQRAEARIAWALDLFARAGEAPQSSQWAIAARPELTGTDYKAMVAKTIDYIEAGDIYQANITQRFRARLHAGIDRLDLYRALRRRNPATFAAFVEFDDVAILSSSPERFLSLRAGQVETRPIKGTRARGRNAREDAALAAELLASEKDRAENLMIVDLLRNDISRVCRMGSVKVPVLWGLESYATVHHLVSVVTGEMLPDKSAVDLLRATFPGGSVTGAPKIRAMEIIAELEPTARGPYCGAIGYLGFDGSLDSNIVIRTYCIKGDDLSFQVGGGIVADSDPALEFEESLTKAKALIETLASGGGQVRSDVGGSAA